MAHLQGGDWISVADAAKLLKMSVRRAQILIAEGRLKATKLGDRVFVLLKSDVEAFAAVDRPRGRPTDKPRKPVEPKNPRKS